ncbi:MAG: CPBP family intramembrane metalloprotease [Solirubrobacterales bacterium]|nr:CPBP family intramembrane metalloprotease [Solirubrobacterales bacterium]
MTSLPPPTTAPPPDLPEVPDGVEPQRPPGSGWAWWMALTGLIAAFAAATVLGVIVFALAGDFQDPPPAASIVATVLQDICLVAVPVLFAATVARPRPVAFVVFTAVWLTAIGQTGTEDDLPKELGVDESTVALVSVALLVTVLAPLAEELFFRGFFFTALRNSAGLWPAAIITGAVFGLIHGGSSAAAFLLPLAVLGLALCLLYVRTGSLYPCIVLHCINNSIAFGSSQGWDWQVPVLMAVALSLIAAILAFVRRRVPDGGVAAVAA